MRSRSPFPGLVPAALLVLGLYLSPALAAEPLRILVLKEHGVGSPTLAQPYLDRFVATAATQNEWSDAKGQYYVTRAAAEDFIAKQHPHYGILSLAAFLDFRIKYNLEVIGKVAVSLVGGQQYFLISKTATDLAGCKGKKLASDHATDPRFIEKVVADGAFVLADFELVPTQRPLQTIREVLVGRADCALIDDAQYGELAKLPGAEALKTAWKSKELPPMVVAAFPSAPTSERVRFQQNFSRVCEADTKPACAEVGISSLDMASAAEYAAVVAAYGN
ncbi:MAG: hypothetical protein ABR538_16000 [Candidatus Binatia bacterium]